jgi:hypothetical protein
MPKDSLDRCGICDGEGPLVRKKNHADCRKDIERPPVCVECWSGHLFACVEDAGRYPSCIWCLKPVSASYFPLVLQKHMAGQDEKRWEEFKVQSERSKLAREGHATIRCNACNHLHHWKLKERPTEIFSCLGCRIDIDPAFCDGREQPYNPTLLKYCPGCKGPYERNKGCRFMICGHCSFSHCYQCQAYLPVHRGCPYCKEKEAKKKGSKRPIVPDDDVPLERKKKRAKREPDPEPKLKKEKKRARQPPVSSPPPLQPSSPVQQQQQQQQQTPPAPSPPPQLPSPEEQQVPTQLDFSKFVAMGDVEELITELRVVLTNEERKKFDEMSISLKEEDDYWHIAMELGTPLGQKGLKQYYAPMVNGLYKLVILRPDMESGDFGRFRHSLGQFAAKHGHVYMPPGLEKQIAKIRVSAKTGKLARYNIYLGYSQSPEVNEEEEQQQEEEEEEEEELQEEMEGIVIATPQPTPVKKRKFADRCVTEECYILSPDPGGSFDDAENKVVFGKELKKAQIRMALTKKSIEIDRIMAFLVGPRRLQAAFQTSPDYFEGFGFDDPYVYKVLYNQGKTWFQKKSHETDQDSSQMLSTAEIKEKYNIKIEKEAAELFQTRAPFNQHLHSILEYLAGVPDSKDADIVEKLLWSNEDLGVVVEQAPRPKKRQQSPVVDRATSPVTPAKKMKLVKK